MRTNGGMIHDEAAWERGRRARIAANARKTWESDPERRELGDWLRAEAWDASPESFIGKMAASLEEWGRLTPRMEEVVKKIRAERIAKRAEREAKWAAERAASGFVGEVGERREFEAEITFVSHHETRFGLLTITGMKDAAGNILIHKGRGMRFGKGTKVRFTATVKAHETWKDTKETILTRPANVTEVSDPAEGETIH